MIFRSPLPDVLIPEMPFTPYVLRRATELAGKAALIDGPTGQHNPPGCDRPGPTGFQKIFDMQTMVEGGGCSRL